MNTTETPQRKLRIINAAWWATVSIIHSLALTNFDVTNTQTLLDSIISNLILACSCILIFNNMRYYLPRNEKYWYVLTISVIVSGICLFISNLVLKLVFKGDEHYLFILGKSLSIRFGVSFLSISCMAMISLLWYTQEEQIEMEARKTEAEVFYYFNFFFEPGFKPL